jgi:hypothetical protein
MLSRWLELQGANYRGEQLGVRAGRSWILSTIASNLLSALRHTGFARQSSADLISRTIC